MNDLRYAIRQLVKNPGFTIVAVLTLALGIGANTAIFSVIDAVLLRPLPYSHPERLVIARERLLGPSGFESGSVAYPNYLDWRASQRSFTDLALVRWEGVDISSAADNTEPERTAGARITANFFSLLGVPPMLGRDVVDADDVANAPKVVLINERLWKRRFGAAPTIIGRRLVVDGVPREIIGVIPDRVRYPRGTELYFPVAELRASEQLLHRDNHESFSALARLKPGVAVGQASADLNTIAAALERRYPDSNTGRRVTAKPMLEYAVGQYRHTLYLLLAAVGCVLLIACANVANLQLARALARGRELAIRAALGASRTRLAQQIVVETVLLALIGGACATLVALWSLDAIRALCPPNVSRFQEMRIDLPTLCFTGLIAAATGIVVGLWPAWKVSRTAFISTELHEGGARGTDSSRRQRMRSLLVIAQVAVAIVLLAGAGLTLKSFWRAQEVPLGFDPHNILTMNLELPEARYPQKKQVAQFQDQLLQRIRTLPGVAAAALTDNAPFDDNEWDSNFHITGTPPNKLGAEPQAEESAISPDYFRVLGMPILRGRAFNATDTLDRPRSAIIDETFAQRYFAGKDPIGQHIDDNQTLEKNPPPLTVVGVVPRTRNEAPNEGVERRNLSELYYCAAQLAEANYYQLLVRAIDGQDPMSLLNSVKREISQVDPEQAVSEVKTMDESIAASLASRRLTMTLLGVFAALALGLASVGLYGVMALTVTQRTRELGIRLALGAHRADVFRLVLGQGMLLVGIGLVCGWILAISTGRGLASVLYNVSAWDLPAFLAATTALALVALIACWLPARRATRVDPIVALRTE